VVLWSSGFCGGKGFVVVLTVLTEKRPQREKKEIEIGTISRKTSDSTVEFNGRNPLGIAVTNALELLRGHHFEN
jgi:hypothetical protein